jgi:hypothetical protein
MSVNVLNQSGKAGNISAITEKLLIAWVVMPLLEINISDNGIEMSMEVCKRAYAFFLIHGFSGVADRL